MPARHLHPCEQIVFVVSGHIRFTVGDDVVDTKSGDMLVAPPQVERFAETIGDESAVDLNIFTPRREDYAAREQAL